MMIGIGGLAAACAPAQLTSPPNYSTIGGPTTFTWTQPDLSCINWVKLIVGSQSRASDIATQQVALQAYGDQGTTTTINIPTDGRLIYVSLVSAISFNPLYQDFTYMSGVPSVAAPVSIPVSTSRIPDPTPVSIAPPPVVVAPPAPTNTAVLPRVSVDVLPVITVGQSGAPVNVPPSADTQLPVPQVAAAPSTQTTTVTPGAGTSAANSNPPATSSSGTTTTSSTMPAASTDSGTILGIPTTYALIGAAALVLLMMGKK